MKKQFIAEAKKYQVFPMDASVAARVVAPRPNITCRAHGVRLHAADGRFAQGDSPAAAERLVHDHRRHRRASQGAPKGMILTSGGRFAGYGFYLLEGQAGVPVESCSTSNGIKWEGAEAHCRHRASTPSSSTSSTTGLGVGHAGL